MNKIEKIERIGERIYATIIDGSDDSIFTLRIWDPLSELTDEELNNSVNRSVFINDSYEDEEAQDYFDDRGCSHVDVVRGMFTYFISKKISSIEVIGSYDSKIRYKYELTEAGKRSHVVYLQHNIDWAFELCTEIYGSEIEAKEALGKLQLFSKNKNQTGPDVKIIDVHKKSHADSDMWFNEFTKSKNKDSYETTCIWSHDKLSEFIKYKEPCGSDVQFFIELGLIKPIGPWKPFKNMVIYSKAEYINKEYSN